MKAVVYEKFGSPDVLEYREVEKPMVKEDDILVRIHASSMNAVDWHIRIPTPSKKLTHFRFIHITPKMRGF